MTPPAPRTLAPGSTSDQPEGATMTTDNITVLGTWSVERIRRIGPDTLDAIFAALIEVARFYPDGKISVDFGPKGVEVQAYEPGQNDAEALVFHRAWRYEYSQP